MKKTDGFFKWVADSGAIFELDWAINLVTIQDQWGDIVEVPFDELAGFLGRAYWGDGPQKGGDNAND